VRRADERHRLRHGRAARVAGVRGRGPLALVKTGDVIALDVAARNLTLEVADDELVVRRAAWRPPDDRPTSGYSWLYTQHVLQAADGVDFGFLRGRRGSAVGRESH